MHIEFRNDENSKFLIYTIENKINGKKYVGSTTQGLKRRWAQHKKDAIKNPVTRIAKAIKKYGADNFILDAHIECDDIENMYDWERELISQYDTIKNGYNSHKGGNLKWEKK